jgi:Tol biopolymer transport system component/subtilisin family serine protease
MMKRVIAIISIALIAFGVSPLATQGQPDFSKTTIRRNANAIPNHYIVRLKDEVTSEEVEQTASRLVSLQDGSIIHFFLYAIKGFSIVMSEADAAALSKNPLVAYVEEDAVIEDDSDGKKLQSNSASFSAQSLQPSPPWGLDRIDQRDLPLDNSYTYTNTGAGVNVYVIGTGIRFSHREFGGRAVLGIDTVGDGQDGNDCNGLGTAVAATIGGATYGVAKSATLYSVRAFNCSNGTTVTNLIAAVDWVTGNHISPAIAHISISTGANATIDAAVSNSIASGVSYALAAGDINTDAGNRSPARVAEAITVGGTNILDTRVTTSNFGASLDLFAPGQDIPTASHFSDSASTTRTGTAMAAAHVAGAAALYLQNYPTDTPVAVSQAITSNATTGKVLNPGVGSPNRLLFVRGINNINGKIAFQSYRNDNFDIYIINEDGSGEARLTTDGASDVDPHWSHDGTKIAFASQRAGYQGIYVMNADGSGQTNLTNNPGWDADPNWSPDGTKIVFTSNRDGNTELYVMNSDGTGQTNLTQNPSVDNQPSWSPDGSKIAFVSQRTVASEIYVMNADGSNPVRLTDNNANDFYPAWSPDGYKIAYTSNKDGDYEIYLMNTDGSNQTRITNSPGTESEPAWSPDGAKIAFETMRSSEIYVINASGSGARNITNNSAVDRRAAWQPLPRRNFNRVSDFDGDRKSDIAIWRPSDNIWAIKYSSDSTITIGDFGLSGDRATVRDYDGDGKTDIAVFRPSDSNWYILNSSTGNMSGTNWGYADDSLVPADYDGDGKTDIAVYRPSEGNWYILDSSTNTVTQRFWTVTGNHLLVPADYDGDGKADVAVFRPSDGTWFIRSSSDGSSTVRQWGLSGDKPVPADYDGDGKADIAVFRPSDGIWYIINSSTGIAIGPQWGLSTDVPVPADYNGDRKTDVAVWRPSTGEWYILQISDGSYSSYTFGLSGDVPVPSTYNPN